MLISPHYLDLAGHADPNPNPLQVNRRVRQLIHRYLSLEILHDHLRDLPQQFLAPQTRPWHPICWSNLSTDQILGLDPEVFLKIILGAIDTELPIHGYTQASRRYLEPIHPRLAHYVGGQISAEGQILALGLWEREERQHGPALTQIYTRLKGQKPQIHPHHPRPFQEPPDPYRALYRHGLHRIATEYGAVCLYLWLMAHTTGDLQQVLGELLRDEINHLCKFWGSGIWLYPGSWLQQTRILIQEIGLRSQDRSEGRSNLWNTYLRMTGVLAWQTWSWDHRLEFLLALTLVLQRMMCWSRDLSPEYLDQLFGAEVRRSTKLP